MDDNDMLEVTLRDMYSDGEETVIVPRTWVADPSFDWSQLETVGPGTWYVRPGSTRAPR